MNWATLITELRSYTSTTATNYSDTLSLIDLNKSYHFIEDCITDVVWESYFWNTMSFATVANQSEYTLPTTIIWNLDWTNKTVGVSIDYGSGFIKLIKKDINSLDKDQSWYETNTSPSEWEAFFTIQDNSIMIFPAPTVIWSGKHYIIHNLIDITASTAEEDIFNGKIHKKYHPLIELGARQYAYERRQLKNEAEQARQRFMVELFGGVNKEWIKVPWMMNIINTRQRWARIRQMPPWYSVKQ